MIFTSNPVATAIPLHRAAAAAVDYDGLRRELAGFAVSLARKSLSLSHSSLLVSRLSRGRHAINAEEQEKKPEEIMASGTLQLDNISTPMSLLQDRVCQQLNGNIKKHNFLLP